ALVSPGGRRRPAQLRPPAPVQTPRPWWRALAVAMFPSTYSVVLLTAIALGFNRDLAAFLAGVLIGLGAVPLVYALSRLKVRLGPTTSSSFSRRPVSSGRFSPPGCCWSERLPSSAFEAHCAHCGAAWRATSSGSH